MRKYLATIFGVAVGVMAAILGAARADEDQPDRRAAAGGRVGGA